MTDEPQAATGIKIEDLALATEMQEARAKLIHDADQMLAATNLALINAAGATMETATVMLEGNRFAEPGAGNDVMFGALWHAARDALQALIEAKEDALRELGVAVEPHVLPSAPAST